MYAAANARRSGWRPISTVCAAECAVETTACRAARGRRRVRAHATQPSHVSAHRHVYHVYHVSRVYNVCTNKAGERARAQFRTTS